MAEQSSGTPFQLQIADDWIIRGDWYQARSERSLGTIILCHGYKGFKNWGMFPLVARELAEQVDVVAINFSHNGVGEDGLEFTELEKFAKATYTKDLEDLEAVIREIQGSTEAAKPIILLGHSRGAGVSLIYALDHPGEIAGVISWNGITNVDLLTDANKEEMRKSGRTYTLNGRTKQQMPLDIEILDDMERNRERFDIIQRISGAQFPITLIQGTEDGEHLTRGSAKLVANNSTIQWVRVPGGNHTFGSVHPFAGETESLRTAITETKLVIRRMLGETE
ncbi:alpha/beta hydrolase family protein [Paenibacillus roseipurpureus]|uniref:Alpha/beta fold hydrolase n=1 Tax=Paenibacillus roseopurpureus TaxID=2918901 RepID=A0AA96RMI3_9BACL|nr:alpha/beta fold hydrolase [Paenibacillus sp. MBLB1832]WNR46491.1 alpha/beta fold hydrolase [Paenibacillus sp. MBLB1832]